MPVLSEHSVFIFIAQIGIILLAARIFGEISLRLGQPIIVGEVIAGILLGPSILGAAVPGFYRDLFPLTGHIPYLMQGISWLCVLFLLLITGLEIDFRASLYQGRSSLLISILTLVAGFLSVYFVMPFLPAYIYPEGVNPLHVHLMCAMSLAVIAIPVIAKILFDLKILQTEVGLKIMTAGVLSDVLGWVGLTVLIAMISDGDITFMTWFRPVMIMALYLFITLRYGHAFVDKLFNVVGFKKMDTSVALSLLFSLALLNGAIAHLLGIHVIFGAFIAGIMAGESDRVTPYIRQWLQDFIFAVFAPIFFVMIGMQLEVTKASSWAPIILLLLISSLGKVGGAFLGASLTGLGRKNAIALSLGLNTQGTMGVIVALIGFEMGILNRDLFSIIVIICILTSIIVGPLLKWALGGIKRPLAKFLKEEHVFLDVEAKDKKQVIGLIVSLMEKRGLIKNPKLTKQALLEREETLSSAIGCGVALPHARLMNIPEPILCFFRLKTPIDYESPDNLPVSLLFLELTDKNDDGMQLNLISQVAKFVGSDRNRQRLLTAKNEKDIHQILSFDINA